MLVKKDGVPLARQPLICWIYRRMSFKFCPSSSFPIFMLKPKRVTDWLKFTRSSFLRLSLAAALLLAPLAEI